jgi:hypothetical protein
MPLLRYPPSNSFATGSKVLNDRLESVLVDYSHPFGRNTQLDEAIFAFQPEFVVVNVRQEAPPRLVVRVGHIVPGHGPFAGHLTYLGHVELPAFP